MKGSHYFSHDYNARQDENVVPLLVEMGAEGYGLFWMIVEELYQANGRLNRNCAVLAYTTRQEASKLKRVVEDFKLFYFKGDKFGSHSIDRRLAERNIAREQASIAGRASAEARAQRALNGGSTDVQPERKKERKKERKTDAPAASDFSNHRLRIGGELQGVFVTSLPLETARTALFTGRPNKDDSAALKWWVAQKQGELSAPRSGQGMQKS